MTRVDPSSPVAGLINKRWDLLAEYKDRAVRARKVLGLAECLRVTSELRALMKYWNPSWPTEHDREEDLETHRRVAEALAATASPSPRIDRPRRLRSDRRVRRRREA